MNPLLRRTLGLTLAVGVTVMIGLLSRLPYAEYPGEEAFIRLAWRSVGTAVRECRRLTPEELERLPVHMRREEECERQVLPERLDVALDGSPVVGEMIRAAGMREDRPLFVYRELRVPAGVHHLKLAFTRVGPETGVASVQRDRGDREAERGERRGTPASLVLDTTLALRAREIVLVTYDANREALVVVQPGGGTRPTPGAPGSP